MAARRCALNKPPVPEPPRYLAGALREQFTATAAQLSRSGSFGSLDADLLAKLLLAENNYIRISEQVQRALSAADSDEATRWIAAQDKLTRTIITLRDALGLSRK